MKEERVNLTNIDADKLADSTKAHLQEMGLTILHEEKTRNIGA